MQLDAPIQQAPNQAPASQAQPANQLYPANQASTYNPGPVASIPASTSQNAFPTNLNAGYGAEQNYVVPVLKKNLIRPQPGKTFSEGIINFDQFLLGRDEFTDKSLFTP